MKLFKHQQWHFLCLIILLTGIYFSYSRDASFSNGQQFGLTTKQWFILSMLAPIIHQVYVLICWRLELIYNSLSNIFGKKSFKYYKIGFALLILSRLITIGILACASNNTLQFNKQVGIAISIIFLILSSYLFYSVVKYFGIDRAFGIDHFEPKIYKNKPLVKKGIFKYTSNGMYIYGFMILWVPALLLLSKPAIIVALFNHLYIWVHYYFTELPDMKMIYAK